MSTTWFCELHRLTTTTDCPKCDDEQIADLDAYAKRPTCHTCGRTLHEGEQAWASDWTVIEPTGVRTEVRYTCDGCQGCLCESEHDGDYGSPGHPGSCPPHTCAHTEQKGAGE